MAKSGPMQFLREVKTEAKKITWPTRHETIVSTIAVFFMVSVIAIFLYFADQIIALVIRMILGF